MCQAYRHTLLQIKSPCARRYFYINRVPLILDLNADPTLVYVLRRVICYIRVQEMSFWPHLLSGCTNFPVVKIFTWIKYFKHLAGKHVLCEPLSKVYVKHALPVVLDVASLVDLLVAYWAAVQSALCTRTSTQQVWVSVSYSFSQNTSKTCTPFYYEERECSTRFCDNSVEIVDTNTKDCARLPEKKGTLRSTYHQQC